MKSRIIFGRKIWKLEFISSDVYFMRSIPSLVSEVWSIVAHQPLKKLRVNVPMR